MMFHRTISALVATGLLAASTAAQGFPFPNSGSLYRDVRDDSLRRLSPRDAADQRLEVQAVDPVQGEDLEVSHFVVFGNSVLSNEDLTALLAPFSHTALSPAQLREAIDTLRSAYRQLGYFAAQVYLPPQAIEDGIVTLHVYQGVLARDGVSLINEGGQVRDSAITDILQHNLATGQLMTTGEFERSILLVDDLPGVTSHSVIYPGDVPGEARFLMQTQDTPRVTGNVDIDNFGNYYTGEERLGATVYVNSPTGAGDQLTFRAVTSGSDSNYGFVEYSRPVGGSGLRLGAIADFLDYELGEELEDGGFEGDAWSARAYAAYPVVRSRHHNVFARVEYAYLSLDDDDDSGVFESDRTLHTLTVGLSGDHDDNVLANGVTFFDVGVTGGDVDIDGGEAFAAFDEENVGSDGTFLKFNADISRLQHLVGNWSASGRLAGQWASGNLDVSQKFFLGGPFSVPGYPVGEMSGDYGANAQADIRYDVWGVPWGGALQLSVFGSAGWVRLYSNTWDGWEGPNTVISNNLTLYSWGVAAAQTWSNGVVLRASVGRQLGDNDGRNPVTGEDTDQSDDDYRAWFQVIYYFGGV